MSICYTDERTTGSGVGRGTGSQYCFLPLWARLTRGLRGGVEAGSPARSPPQLRRSPKSGDHRRTTDGENTQEAGKTRADARGLRKLGGRPTTGSQWRLQAGRSRIPEAQGLCGWTRRINPIVWVAHYQEPRSQPIGKMSGWCIIPRAMGTDRGKGA